MFLYILYTFHKFPRNEGERGGSVVECRTPEREVRGSKPTAAMLCVEQDTLLPESTG